MPVVMRTITPVASSRNSGLVPEGLVERDRELAVLRQCLGAAARGSGGTVFIEAPPGGGRSRLLAAAHDIARESGMRVLSAAGAELEREWPFCLAMRLFEPLRILLDDDDPLRQDAAALETALRADIGRGSTEADGRQYPLIHGLFQITQHLAGPRPHREQSGALAILIDDLHFADRPSLRFLAYVAERAAQLPIAIVLASTPGERSAEPRELATLRRAGAGRLLQLAPLGVGGVARVVRRRFPLASTEFSASCAQASGGNPFLLTELLSVLAEDEQARTAAPASGVGDIVPDVVRDAVAARLESVPAGTRAVAEAVAVLGDAASMARVAELTALDSEAVLFAARDLAAMHLLAPGISLSFAQPMLGNAIRATLAPFERAHAHLRAARILARDHADAELIAVHLLEAPAGKDAAAVSVLREAGEAARRSGEPERAIRLLRRALAEQPAQATRVELLRDLASAEAEAGLPHATDRLSEARRISEHPEGRAELALAHGRALCAQGNFWAAADVLRAGLDELDGGSERGTELRAAYVMAAGLVPQLSTEALELRDELIADRAKAPGPRARAAIAHTLVLDALRGAPRPTIAELGELAWGDGSLLQLHNCAPLSGPLLATGLLIADDLERSLEITDAVLDLGSNASPRVAHELLTAARACALYEQGRVTEAEAYVAEVLDGAMAGGHSHGALAALARCHVERGRLEQAEAILASLECSGRRDSVLRAVVLDARAQLRLAQHRPQDALQDAMHAAAVLGEELADASPGATAWRSTAALAHLALGEPDRARELVEDELERAQNSGVTRIVIRDLRILGLALGRERNGIERLAEAVALGGSQPSRLEYVRALIDYGAALRRANRRREARDPLRLGLDLSHRGGASVLESRARTELIAAGARPRRAALVGADALTPSQRRVAKLAAGGLTTRQISAALFVTPKTVEFHLRNIYSKLGVATREELAKQLSGGHGRPAPDPVTRHAVAVADASATPRDLTSTPGARGSDG